MAVKKSISQEIKGSSQKWVIRLSLTIVALFVMRNVQLAMNDGIAQGRFEAALIPEDPALSKKYDVCMVGAGLSGSVLAERYSTELKASVLMIDKRDHIGGNCYDYIDKDTGIRVSQYGAHLFHTQYPEVESYVKRFGPWVKYEHKVRGIVNGKSVPIPVNIETVNTLFDLNIQNEDEMKEWLEKEQIPVQGEPENSEEVALARVGRRLYELIFKPYTFKQWNKYPKDLGPEVLSRIPVRSNHDDRYFSDPFQALPKEGYTAFFQHMLSSPLITVKLNTDYFEIEDTLKRNCGRLYYTGPIDAYFAYMGWEKLEYRSLTFERVVEKNVDFFQDAFVVNHPQNDTDYTRIVEYKHLLDQKSNHTVYFIERSTDGGEPYYPVPNEKNQELFRRYKELAAKEDGVRFVGRLANYKYFNMDQAIKNALDMFEQDTGIATRADGDIKGNHGNITGAITIQKGLLSYAEKLKGYSNKPPVEMNAELEASLRRALARPVDEPYGLKHKAHPPGRDVVMGLAAYPTNMYNFRVMVGSLRSNGYDGHIILGVHKDIPAEEEEYLKKMDVTYYTADFVDCDARIMDAGDGGGTIRGKCMRGLEDLKVEWGRFEQCRQWLKACEECTGWALVMDTRDIFFQAHPFISLPPPEEAKEDLLFIEEIAPHTNPKPDDPQRAFVIGQSRYVGRTEKCYGNYHYRLYHHRPVLCSGTIIGTREGMHRMLSVLVDEFHENNKKTNIYCRSPHATDQWTMNYLYYQGRFGEFDRTKTVPWGTGPCNTIGMPCINPHIKDQSKKHSQNDLTAFDDNNMILNIHEPDDSLARVSPIVHQYDRCANWIRRWFMQHPSMIHMNGKGGYIPIEELSLPWKEAQ